MRLLARQRELQQPEALTVGDDADMLIFGLEDWSLFDVVFEIGVHLARAHLFVAIQPMRASSSPKRRPSMSLRS